MAKLHHVLSFKQGKGLKTYVQLITQKRKEAKTKFEEDFSKLMVSSSFGKTCEGKRNQIRVKIVRTEEEVYQWTNQPEFQSFKIFDENLAYVTLSISEVLWDKPTIVGACILDLSKKFMFDFHYNTMKKHFDCTLLYSDTDPFVYEIRSRDFFDELQKKQSVMDQFDFSNFPSEHPLHNRTNARKTLKFKDEMADRSISEFCGLKPKLYSIAHTEGNF